MTSRAQLVAPLTAALIAQQVASNAVRDGLFLTGFQVTSLPYFMAAAAVLAIPAAESSAAMVCADLLEAAATIRVSRAHAPPGADRPRSRSRK